MKSLRIISTLFFFVQVLFVSGCGGGSSSSTPAALTATSFSAKMDGAQETPAVVTAATGTGSFSLNTAKTELTFNITVDGLSGPITAAHFHNGVAGVAGGVVRTLTTDFTGNTATGVWKLTDGEPLTPAMVVELEGGRIYVNVHTAAHPGGEIRGQVILIPAGSAGFSAKMDGAQETPAVATAATGTGSFSLNAAKTELTFDITVDGLSGPITAAHFHNGAAGVAGGVVRTLTTDFTGNTATGVWKNNDGEPLTPAMVTELEGGRLYVNVHTAAHPGGEIRGQVNPNP